MELNGLVQPGGGGGYGADIESTGSHQKLAADDPDQLGEYYDRHEILNTDPAIGLSSGQVSNSESPESDRASQSQSQRQ